jgi:uncharacterized protein (DUF433 family)
MGQQPSLNDILTSDPEIMSGALVFRGTRVPIEVLFENLADGITVDEILADYESLSRSDVIRVLELTSSALARPAAAA